MPLTYDDVHTFASSLAGVTVGARWNNKTWLVGERGFIWERPFSKADLARFGDTPAPSGPILGVHVGSLDAKDALLALDLPGFFTIEHFNGFPGILVALSEARVRDVQAVIREAHATAVAFGPKKPAVKKPTTKTKQAAAKKPPARKRAR